MKIYIEVENLTHVHIFMRVRCICAINANSYPTLGDIILHKLRQLLGCTCFFLKTFNWFDLCVSIATHSIEVKLLLLFCFSFGERERERSVPPGRSKIWQIMSHARNIIILRNIHTPNLSWFYCN